MIPKFQDEFIRIFHGDVREVLPFLEDRSVHCCVTSPPYWGLRNYGVPGQLGLEKTPEEYIARMVEVFREVKRVLRDDGTLWLNMGDSYCSGSFSVRTDSENCTVQNWSSEANRIARNGRPPGYKPKDLMGMPWMLAFALRADGWYLRSDIIWSKPNPMPESVTDRPTKAHEYIFLLTKEEKYYYDAAAIAEDSISNDGRKPYARGQVDARGNGHDRGGGSPRIFTNRDQDGRWNAEKRNKRTVWEIPTMPFPEAHFATFPEELIKPCILAGCPAGGTVLDPFMGSGTMALVARKLGCHSVGVELNESYIEISRKRLAQQVLAL